MYIVREIFHLQFGRFKEAKALIDEALQKGLLALPNARFLSDFTGAGYRIIFESSYKSLAEFEKELTKEMSGNVWKIWYENFKPLIHHSEREILKQI